MLCLGLTLAWPLAARAQSSIDSAPAHSSAISTDTVQTKNARSANSQNGDWQASDLLLAGGAQSSSPVSAATQVDATAQQNAPVADTADTNSSGSSPVTRCV